MQRRDERKSLIPWGKGHWLDPQKKSTAINVTTALRTTWIQSAAAGPRKPMW